MESGGRSSNLPAAYQPGSAAGLTASAAEHRDLGAAYAVSLSVFEGPLDLLLYLIEQEQLDISEVSLVAVTDQYLRTIEQMERPVPGALADFLVVASRLLYIKSTRLLPKPLAEDEEEQDAGALLVRHLLEYRRFKRIADELRLREAAGRVYVRPPGAVELPDGGARLPDFGELDVALLRKALQKALERVATIAPPPSVHPYTVTVAERMEGIRRRLAAHRNGEQASLSFSALLAEADSRQAIVVTFLAVLELVKQRELAAVQEDTFGEIHLTALSGAEAGTLASPADEEERATEEPGAGEADGAEQD